MTFQNSSNEMTVERHLVWVVAVAVAAVFAVSYAAPPTPTAQLVVAVLGGLVVIPVAFIVVGWLLGIRGGKRGWN